jgi:hypothetical protein
MVAININELLAHRAGDLRIQQGETKTISGGDPKIAGPHNGVFPFFV